MDFIYLIFLIPAIVIPLWEMRKRSQYPIRAEVIIQTGINSITSRNKIINDRIGYFDIENGEGEKTGAKEWRLMNCKGTVNNFDQSFIYEKKIWFGIKKADFCQVIAKAGEKGEEFTAIAFNKENNNLAPQLDQDNALGWYRIYSKIQARNKQENWLKQNIVQLALFGMGIVICILLFLISQNLSDGNKILAGAIDRTNACAEITLKYLNNTNMTKNTTVNTIGGVPFAFGGG